MYMMGKWVTEKYPSLCMVYMVSNIKMNNYISTPGRLRWTLRLALPIVDVGDGCVDISTYCVRVSVSAAGWAGY